MIESSFTLYKLIILYMLQNVNFPLSNTQISDFILEKEYTNYFHLQEALSELQDTKLIEIEKVRNTSYYHMTEEGQQDAFLLRKRDLSGNPGGNRPLYEGTLL